MILKSSKHITTEEEKEKKRGRSELWQLGDEKENSGRKWKM